MKKWNLVDFCMNKLEISFFSSFSLTLMSSHLSAFALSSRFCPLQRSSPHISASNTQLTLAQNKSLRLDLTDITLPLLSWPKLTLYLPTFNRSCDCLTDPPTLAFSPWAPSSAASFLVISRFLILILDVKEVGFSIVFIKLARVVELLLPTKCRLSWDEKTWLPS